MSMRSPRTMTQEEVEAYKRAMLEKYEQQRLENEAIKRRMDAEKQAKAESERRKKEEEEARRANEMAKKRSEEEARRALELHWRQQEEEAAQRMLARAPSFGINNGGRAPAMPMSARGPSGSSAPPVAPPASARRGLPVIDDLYMQAAALAEGHSMAATNGEPRDVVRGSDEDAVEGGQFDAAIQLELETIQSLIESASATDLLISAVPFDAALELEEDRALARKLEAEEAERKRKEEEERRKREYEAEQMAKQLNFNFTISTPIEPVPAKKPAADALDADFDAMLANLQQATADLEF